MKAKIIIILLLSIFIVSCGEKKSSNRSVDNDPLNDGPPINPLDSFGVIHNEFLDTHFALMHPHSYDCKTFYTLDDHGTKYSKFTYIDSLKTHIRIAAINRGWEESLVDTAYSRFENILNASSMLDTINNVIIFKETRSNIYTIINASINLGYMSQSSYNIISNIVDAYYNENYTLMDSLFEALVPSIYTGYEDQLYIFKSIYEHSKTYWSNFGTPENKVYDPKKNNFLALGKEKNKIMVSDAVLFGAAVADAVWIFTLGGVGAVISPIGSAMAYKAISTVEAMCFCGNEWCNCN
ncbi:MAG: hypothetical protein A2X61_06945 [Ignavibacteria bacterium GWB2_35_12]|nr:MAG: hypothetical protein A2X61_06945 [Ignavibacteria bacterium GWB2_35_12]OGU93837.1 MAG: hypothetical protein A2220_11810 [Ignavibacteria bacterium RIFOXYA2_FULL_35_10]OGV22045.1 MAG: hypothetical protein A2475_09445 [Ignavibacteria bacterium RIFOXYC2_FULL_35_21]